MKGGTYFFTVNLADRHSDLLVRHASELRAAIERVKLRHPFATVAFVVLPENKWGQMKLSCIPAPKSLI